MSEKTRFGLEKAHTPENECRSFAGKLGGYEPEMIKAIALELEEGNKASRLFI